MRHVATFVAQLLVALFVTGALLPLLLAGVPAVRDGRRGVFAMLGIALAAFLILRRVWPRPRR